LKILHISASYRPAYIYGGPIKSVSMLAEQLVIAGIDVHVFSTTANGKVELAVKANESTIIEGVKTTYFKRVTKDHTQFSPALLLYLWRTCKDYDVIHIHAWWNLVAILSCLIAKCRNVPVVVSPRGMLSNYSFHNKNNFAKKLIHWLFTKPLLRHCFVHTTSENEHMAVSKLIVPKYFFNLPNFIELGESKILIPPKTNSNLKIIFLSRIEEKKGLDILLRSLYTVTAPFILSIVGDGKKEYVDSLKAIATKNGIHRQIKWLGFRVEDKFDLLRDQFWQRSD
jgi:glycosyltransferase involved in cell wall biosynthesis